jgi:hypothetical protein
MSSAQKSKQRLSNVTTVLEGASFGGDGFKTAPRDIRVIKSLEEVRCGTGASASRENPTEGTRRIFDGHGAECD